MKFIFYNHVVIFINILVVEILSVPETLLSVSKNESISIYDPSPYNLEDYCNSDKEKAEFSIESWKGAIFQVGYVFDSQGNPKSRKIHRCKVHIKTHKDFWLVAAVEHMKIRGSRDSSNKWKCSDFVKFTAPGRSLVNKLFSVFDLNVFTAKESEKLCGDKHLDGMHMSQIFDISTDANSFYTASNELTLDFHQKNTEKHSVNNSFKIVVTTFRHASEQVECENKQKCFGGDIYCIDKRFICDGHVNCAFPGSGTDEKLCRAKESEGESFNFTSIIIVTLMSIIAFGILICILSTLFCRIKSRLDNEPRSRPTAFSSVPFSHPPTAPRIEHEETLPAYETVILGDASTDKITAGVEEGELPPQYDSLFPDGPPASKEDSERNPVR